MHLKYIEKGITLCRNTLNFLDLVYKPCLGFSAVHKTLEKNFSLCCRDIDLQIMSIRVCNDYPVNLCRGRRVVDTIESACDVIVASSIYSPADSPLSVAHPENKANPNTVAIATKTTFFVIAGTLTFFISLLLKLDLLSFNAGCV